MSAAAKPAEAAPKGGKKKLLLIVLALVLVLGAGGAGAAIFIMKKQAAAAAAELDEEDAGDAGAERKTAKVDPKALPTFLPLDPFVVNLADRDSDRYAQIGITLRVDDAAFAEQMKAFMPAIRNNILMILAHKTSDQLLAREGKEQLAETIAREAVRPMGIEIDPPEAEADEPAAGSKKKRRKKQPHNQVQQVLFSSFIVQ